MFRIKICGVTTSACVAASSAAGADAIGLNCYPKSRRYLAPIVAKRIAAEIPRQVARVGVFVNESVETVLRLADDLQLDFIQLHGDETADYVSRLDGRPYLRAFRFGNDGVTPIVKFLSNVAELGCSPAAILVDAHVPGEYGGTGQPVDWDQLRAQKRDLGPAKLILAGGLTPDNVAAAIARVEPFGVDTAGGVETSTGKKNAELAAKFVQQARDALGIKTRYP